MEASEFFHVKYDRLYRYWRKAETKNLDDFEWENIEAAIEEEKYNKLLRELRRQRQRSQYLKQMISGEIQNERKKNSPTSNRTNLQGFGHSSA